MRPCLVLALFGVLWLPPLTSASADILITVDKTTQRMSVNVDGEERYSWPVSTGVPDHDTPSGDYRAFRMEKDHFSKEWDDAPMPYSIFFTGEGHAIHGTSHVRQLGRPASHGCVRLAKNNAAVLFALVKSEGLGKTHVVVEGDGVMAADLMGPGVKVARPRHARTLNLDDEALPPVREPDPGQDSVDYDYNIGGM